MPTCVNWVLEAKLDVWIFHGIGCEDWDPHRAVLSAHGTCTVAAAAAGRGAQQCGRASCHHGMMLLVSPHRTGGSTEQQGSLTIHENVLLVGRIRHELDICCRLMRELCRNEGGRRKLEPFWQNQNAANLQLALVPIGADLHGRSDMPSCV